MLIAAEMFNALICLSNTQIVLSC